MKINLCFTSRVHRMKMTVGPSLRHLLWALAVIWALLSMKGFCHLVSAVAPASVSRGGNLAGPGITQSSSVGPCGSGPVSSVDLGNMPLLWSFFFHSCSRDLTIWVGIFTSEILENTFSPGLITPPPFIDFEVCSLGDRNHLRRDRKNFSEVIAGIRRILVLLHAMPLAVSPCASL